MICPPRIRIEKRSTKLDLCPEFSLAQKLETESPFMFCEREALFPSLTTGEDSFVLSLCDPAHLGLIKFTSSVLTRR